MSLKLTFKKDELIDDIKKQRAEHHKVFFEACKKYQTRVLIELTNFMERVKKGERPRIMSALPVPEVHTADFDRAIEMLESCIEKHVELDEEDYRTYVQGEWDWRMSFAANTLSYTTHS